MKAVFGVISLLVVLAIVGVLASRQLKATTATVPAAASAAAAVGLVLPAASSGGTPAEQSKQVQEQVMNDVMKAMQQGADADKKEPE